MVTNTFLAKIAVIGGVITIGTANVIRWKIESNLKQSQYFQLAIKKLVENETAVTFLGEPVLIGSLDLGNTDHNYCDGLRAQFHVPVKGSKTSATLFFRASRNPPDQPDWKLNTLELTNKTVTKKLVIVSENTEPDS